jgi:peroxiredoxin
MRLLLGLLTAVLFFSCAEKNNFILHGKIEGVGNDKIILGSFDMSTRNFNALDTALVENGKFVFKRMNIATGNYIFKFQENNFSFSAILENGNLNLKGNVQDVEQNYLRQIVLEGAVNQPLLDAYRQIPEDLINDPKYKKSKELRNKMQEVPLEQFQDVKAVYEEASKDYFKESWRLQKELLYNNIDKYFVADQFHFIKQKASVEEIKDIYSKLPPAHQVHPRVMEVMEDVRVKESITAGKIAPDFTLKNPEGKDITLSDLRGKYVLIDFWASWCKPCRKAFPHMKELYAKYNSKGFEILGITNDTNHKLWKKAIEKDGLPWINVADEFPKKHGGARVIKEYGMDYLPSTVLIDKEGIIIGKLYHGDELDKKLEEIFSK